MLKNSIKLDSRCSWLPVKMSQRQFLPLDEDSMDTDREFNLNEMTAMEYLKQVRFERRTIPQVVTVHPMVSEPEVPPKEVKKFI